MTDLNVYSPCSESLESEITTRMENKLSNLYKYELIKILMNENNEIQSLCKEIKDEQLREIINSYDDDDDDFDDEDSMSESEDEISELNSSDYISMIKRMSEGRNCFIKMKF